MTIARGQMKRQLYQTGSGIDSLNIPMNERILISETLEPESRDYINDELMSAEDREVMERLMELQRNPEYQYDEENMYEGPRDMRMGGGIMSVRQPYFLGGVADFVGDIVGGAGDAVGGVFDTAKEGVESVVGDIGLEEIAAIAAIVAGVPAPFVSTAYGASGRDNQLFQTGLNLYGGYSGGQGQGGTFGFPQSGGGSGGTFGFPGGGQGQGGLSDALRVASNFGLQGSEDDRKDEQQDYGINEKIEAILRGMGKTVPTFPSGDVAGFDIMKVLKKIFGDKEGDVGKGILGTGAGATLAKLTYEDQKKFIEEIKKRIAEQRADVETYRGKLKDVAGTGRATGVPTTTTDVVRSPVTAAQGGRIGFAGGSKILKGFKNLLDEAYEMVSSRSDFDFSDYKMRGTLMAEELAELKYGKSFDDLDLNTQMDLYQESSDYLNDVAADAADNARDMMKERFNKAQGGIINSRKGYMMGSEIPMRQNPAGIQELDYRQSGGFVPPIGIKEKADDIPAMLSNNEFVFTANAVGGADPEGKGDRNRGAQAMYALMKQLEGQA